MPKSLSGALRLQLRPSPAVAVALATAHAGAALGALALPLYPWSAWIAAVALLASMWRSLARHAFRRGSGAVVGIAHSEPEGWRLTAARGERIESCSLSSAFVHPRLIVLSFSTPQGRTSVLVPRGATEADESRRLRIALRRVSARSVEPAEDRVLNRLWSCVLQSARRLGLALPDRIGERATTRVAG